MTTEKQKEYQKQYYRNVTKLRRLRGEIKASPTKYQKLSDEERREAYRRGAKKRVENMREKLGDEGMREHYSKIGQKGRSASTYYHFTKENASEFGKLGARARGLKSKHKKVRKKYETRED